MSLRSIAWTATILAGGLLALSCTWAGAQSREAADQVMAGVAPGVGARAAAMGDAHVAAAADATALYWNPAGLALGGEKHWHAASARAEGYHLEVDELADMLETAQGTVGIGGRHWDLLEQVADGQVDMAASAFSAFRSGSWALGGFSQAWSTVDIRRQGPGRISVRGSGMDATNVGAAYGGRAGKALYWGVQAGWLRSGRGRARGSVLNRGGEIVNAVHHRTNHAAHLSVSVGLLHQPSEHVWWGIVGRNLNSPRLEYFPGDVLTYQPSVHVGFAAENPEERALFALDVHNVFEAHGVAPKLCVGLEKRVGSGTMLRFGGTRSRLTCGVGFRTGSWQIDLASGSAPRSQASLSAVVDL